MTVIAFNYDNPWHAWADFLFDFYCDGCATQVAFHWPQEDSKNSWFAACVDTAEEAQRLGWTCVDYRTFLCPECSMKRRDPD